MLRLTFPYLLFISLVALASGILNSYGRFAVPAFTPVLLNVVMIVFASLIAPKLCHDFISPSGAIMSGLDLLNDPSSQDMRDDAVGLITEAQQAETILQEGQADLVALARGILFDPRWPWHAAAELGAQVDVPPQYWRSQPRDLKGLFGDAARIGQR